MYIDESCIGCGDCVVFCPQGAIALVEDKAHINRSACLECGVCLDTNVCPQEAVCESSDELSWIKKLFGRLIDSVPGTSTVGRAGGFDVKTNDVTGRIPEGMAVVRIELMRPVGGISLFACETIKDELESAGYSLKPTKRYEVLKHSIHELTNDPLKHQVLTTSFETVLAPNQVNSFIRKAEEHCKAHGFWFSANLACTATSLEDIQNALLKAGLIPQSRAKVNLGLGKRSSS